MHDGLAQDLALANMLLDRLETSIIKDKLKTIFIKSFDDIKILCQELREHRIDDFSFSLVHLFAYFEDEYGLIITKDIQVKDLPSLGIEYESQLLKIIRELFMNVVRHSKSNRVDIKFQTDEDILKLIIRDYGIGIEDFVEGLGIIGIRERVHLLNGHITWKSERYSGTIVQMLIPILGNKGI